MEGWLFDYTRIITNTSITPMMVIVEKMEQAKSANIDNVTASNDDSVFNYQTGAPIKHVMSYRLIVTTIMKRYCVAASVTTKPFYVFDDSFSMTSEIFV